MTRCLNVLRRFRTAQAGASAIEFALILPAFMMIIFGIVMFGSYLTMVHGVQQLAAEAARSSVAGLSEGERRTLANDYVAANAGAYPLLLPAHLKVSAGASSADANVFVVTVDYDASGMFIYSLPSFVPAPPATIVRSAAIPRGGY